LPTVGNGSAKQPIYSRAGACSRRNQEPEGQPSQRGRWIFAFGEKDGRGITKNPKGSLPLEWKVSAEQTDEVFLQKPVIKKESPSLF